MTLLPRCRGQLRLIKMMAYGRASRRSLRPQLAEHAAAIRALEDRNGHIWRLERRNVFKIGQRLITVKALVGHGYFLKWMQREFRWSLKTGQNYMNVAKAFGDKSETVTNLPITITALYLLSDADVPKEARDTALEIAARSSGLIVDRTMAKGIIEDWVKKLRRERPRPRRGGDLLADKLPRKPIPPIDIVARMAKFERDVKDLSALCKLDDQARLPSEENDRKFARNVRRILLDLVIMEFTDDDDNFALLRERVELARQSRNCVVSGRTHDFVRDAAQEGSATISCRRRPGGKGRDNRRPPPGALARTLPSMSGSAGGGPALAGGGAWSRGQTALGGLRLFLDAKSNGPNRPA